MALPKGDAQMLTITLDLEKKLFGDQFNKCTRDELRKRKGKKTEEKAASMEGFESIERKD
jgi:hypothetical protein